MIKVILMLLSFLPLVVHSPYLFQAWSGSRLDHYDWIFYLISIPAAIWALRAQKIGKCDFYALFLLIPCLILTAMPSLHNINALSIISALGVIFSVVWLLGSWNLAYQIWPVVLVLLLGTPSSSYQLSLLLMCPVYAAYLVKFMLAILSLVLIWCNRRLAWKIKRGTFFFTAAVLLTAFILLHTKELYFEGISFIPEFPVHCDGFWGRSIQPDENTKRFFATSQAAQYRYTKDNIDISILSVKCGKNIHEIHPASHCLRTSLWTVHSEKILYLQDNFAVTEIAAQNGSNHILVWVWYSSEKFSTPSFLGFRRHFEPAGNYHTFQISVPLYENAEASSNLLKSFVQALRRKN